MAASKLNKSIYRLSIKVFYPATYLVTAKCTLKHNKNCDKLTTKPMSMISDKRTQWLCETNRISSTTMKLRISLVKPVTWQNIWGCLVLLPNIVVHDAFNVIL